MTCGNCDPATTSTTSNCCLLADSPPGAPQYVKFTVSGVANPQLKVIAYQLGNATPTILTPSGNQRFWIYHLQAAFVEANADARVFWSIGGGPPVVNSDIIRASTAANQVITYNGPAFPLPVSAEIYVLAGAANTVSIVGYGVLGTN